MAVIARAIRGRRMMIYCDNENCEYRRAEGAKGDFGVCMASDITISTSDGEIECPGGQFPNVPDTNVGEQTMSDLISRRDTLKRLCEKCWEGNESTGCSDWKCIEYRIIEDMPPADRLIKETVGTLIHTKGDDAVSVAFRNAGRFVQNAIDGEPPELEKIPTGEWVDADGNKVRLDADGHPLGSCWCSNCGEWLVASDEYKVFGKFCPNCGADMRGNEDGND